ncbi:unnamed protein product, partial [Mesorhabditis belari]|uniref:SUN domain-containing protein n=1 Tax=Mesorhabditis belari TaxID=2138241 RepID=A0AAF3EQE6_9BILA
MKNSLRTLFLLLYCFCLTFGGGKELFVNFITRSQFTCPVTDFSAESIGECPNLRQNDPMPLKTIQIDGIDKDLSSILEAANKQAETTTEAPKQPIVTFDEWTKEKLKQEQKRTEEKIASQPNGNGNPTHLRTESSPTSRNYASKECNAKIVLANPEAENTKALLNDKEKDEYMRNPCEVVQKFFIIELCETIQPHTIELGNFELFSGGPKGVRVSSAERFPAAEWNPIIEVEAQDTRTLQSFSLNKAGVYAKFLKIELLSHYGKEHYCTLTMLRIFGMSIVEEYEAEAEIAAGRIGAASMNTAPQPPSSTAVDKAGIPLSSALPIESTEKLAEKAAEKKEEQKAIEPVKKSTAVDPSNESQSTAGRLLKKIVNVVIEKFVPEKEKKRSHSTWSSTCLTCPLQQNMTSSVRVQLFCQLITLTQKERTTKAMMPNQRLIDRHWSRMRYRRVRTAFLQRLTSKQNLCLVPEAAATKAVPKEEPPVIETPTETLKLGKVTIPEITTPPPAQPVEVEAKPSEEKIEKLPPPLPTVVPPMPKEYLDPLPASSLSQKESIFIKLNKRIALLELNMSLSSEYLSELSRQYVAQSEMQEKNIVRAKIIANEAVQNATAHINITLTNQLEMMRKEVDQLAKFLRSVRKESANLQFRLAAHGFREEPEDPTFCETEEGEENDDELAIGHYTITHSRDGFWTTEQVVYIVVTVQVITAVVLTVLQIIFRRAPVIKNSNGPTLTIDDVNRMIEEKLKEMQRQKEVNKEDTGEAGASGAAAKRRKRRRRKQQRETDSAVDSSLPTASITHSDVEDRERHLDILQAEMDGTLGAHILESSTACLVEPISG